MMKTFHRVHGFLAFVTVVVGMVLAPVVERPHAYVLPSEQVLQFMAAHFSKFDTLVVTHAVERQSWQEAKNFEETLTMKSPDLLHARTKDPFVNQGRVIDRSYRELFLSSTQAKIYAFLGGVGVDTEKASFTRVDGTIAYLIGDEGPDSPKLAVEKARFLPLLLVYPSRLAGGTQLITVTFRDYRQVEQGWYPFEILCSSAQGWTERYRLESIKVNVPVQPSLFLEAQQELRPAETPAKDGKIDAIIKTFEEKYGH